MKDMKNTVDILKSSILVCIPPESSQEILYSLLTSQRFQIEAVKNLDECLEKNHFTQFDALIIDVCFFKMQDKVNTSLLHKLTALLPVIVVAEKEDLEIENKIREEKIFYYLIKPVNQKELIEVIEEAITWSRIQRKS